MREGYSTKKDKLILKHKRKMFHPDLAQIKYTVYN